MTALICVCLKNQRHGQGHRPVVPRNASDIIISFALRTFAVRSADIEINFTQFQWKNKMKTCKRSMMPFLERKLIMIRSCHTASTFAAHAIHGETNKFIEKLYARQQSSP